MHQHSIDDRWIDNSSEIFFSLSVFSFLKEDISIIFHKWFIIKHIHKYIKQKKEGRKLCKDFFVF